MHKFNNHAASTCACRDSFIHHSSLPFLARRGIHHEWDEYLDAVYGRDDASRYPVHLASFAWFYRCDC